MVVEFPTLPYEFDWDPDTELDPAFALAASSANACCDVKAANNATHKTVCFMITSHLSQVVVEM